MRFPMAALAALAMAGNVPEMPRSESPVAPGAPNPNAPSTMPRSRRRARGEPCMDPAVVPAKTLRRRAKLAAKGTGSAT